MQQTIRFGNGGNNALTLGDNGALFGFDGNDTLAVKWNDTDYYQAFMVGGRGNDHYVFNGDIGTIVDTGGNDTLTLPGSSGDYIGAFVEGRDLLLHNELSGQEIFILNAKGRGTVETFRSEYGETLYFSEVVNQIYSQGLGNLSYAELETISGGIFSASEFSAAREINLAWANLDWDGVWQQVSDRGADPEAVANTLNAHLMSMLSPAAQQEWHRQQGPESLRLADFEGVEQNLPSAAGGGAGVPPELLPRDTVEKIALLYEAALDRVPDIGGLNYWIGKAETLSVENIAAYFVDSEEFQQRFDVSTDDQFINQLYLNVLDRPADSGGEAYWLDVMRNGNTEGAVLGNFSSSEENIANATWLAGLEQTDAGWIV